MDDRQLAQEMLAQCVAGRTHQIARIVSQRYDQALKQYGLTSNQLTLLCMVALMQPVSSSAMLPYLKMEQSTLSRNLDRMVDKGWLAKMPDPGDARTTSLELTPEGTAKLHDARAGWDDAQAWALDAFGTGGVLALDRSAHRLNPLMPRGSWPKDE